MTRDADDDSSILGSVRRAVSGPTDAERAGALNERTRTDPDTIEREDVEEALELVEREDVDIVADALGALSSVAESHPDLLGDDVHTIVDGLSTRPLDEWTKPLGEWGPDLSNDMRRGIVLKLLAADDPSHLHPVVDELVEMVHGEDDLEPSTYYALAHVAANDPDRVDVPSEKFVGGIISDLRTSVTGGDAMLVIAPDTEKIDLLRRFGRSVPHETIERTRETIEVARDSSGDDKVIEAAEDALSDLDSR